MDESALETPVSESVAVAAPAPKPRETSAWEIIKMILAPVASLRLTVVLFILSFFLIFCGTLAQVDFGIWTVVNTYFRTGIAWIPFQAFVRLGQTFFGVADSAYIPGSFPFPGGWLLGTLLLVNLLAAHAVRFKFTWKRSGILILHSGLIVMMMGEFITGKFAVEGRMPIIQGGASNHLQHTDTTELAIVDPSDPNQNNVIAIPASLLRKEGMIQDDMLPFDLEVVQFSINSDIEGPEKGKPNLATTGDGLKMVAVKRPEVAGVANDDRADVASAYVTFKKKGTGESLGTYLLTQWYPVHMLRGDPQILFQLGFWPQNVTCDGKKYEVSLRFKRTYKPYTIHLLEFRHDVFEDTNIPRNFSSKVRLVDPKNEQDREVLIYMNSPLSYEGETFYQSGFLPGDRGTVLQVVDNPGSQLPYYSCAMVVVGMLIHFGIHLFGFLRLRIGT